MDMENNGMLTINQDNQKTIRSIISAGTNAANAGNRQPWQFTVFPSYIEIDIHQERSIEKDKNLRKTLISFGGAIQHMLIAASEYRLALDYHLNMTENDMHVRVIFNPTDKVHAYIEAQNRTCVNRNFYDSHHPLSAKQIKQLNQLSPFEQVKIALITEVSAKDQFVDLILEHAKPSPLFRSFDTASIYGAIIADDPFDPAQLIMTGRLLTLLQCWVVQQHLAIQPVGSYMISIFEAHHENHHPVAEAISEIFSNPEAMDPVLAFRIGKPLKPLEKSERERLPVDKVISWHL